MLIHSIAITSSKIYAALFQSAFRFGFEKLCRIGNVHRILVIVECEVKGTRRI